METQDTGDMRIALFMPPFSIKDLQAGFKQKLTMFLTKRKLE